VRRTGCNRSSLESDSFAANPLDELEWIIQRTAREPVEVNRSTVTQLQRYSGSPAKVEAGLGHEWPNALKEPALSRR